MTAIKTYLDLKVFPNKTHQDLEKRPSVPWELPLDFAPLLVVLGSRCINQSAQLKASFDLRMLVLGLSLLWHFEG